MTSGDARTSVADDRPVAEARPATADAPEPRPRPSRFLVLGLGMMTTLMAVCGSLGAPMILQVAHDYQVSVVAAQWTVTLPYLTGALATPIVGWLANTRFRRPTLLGITALVSLGSLAGVLPLDYWALLIGRGLQGLGLGLVPVAIAVARDVVPPERRIRTIAVLSVTNVIGGGIGFPLAAGLVQFGGLRFGYGTAFVSTFLTLVVLTLTVPRGHDHDSRPVDWLGAVLIGGGTAVVLLGLSQQGAWGLTSPAVIGLMVLGILALLAWGWWSVRTRHPLINIRLMGSPLPLAVNLTSLLAGIGVYISMTVCIVLAQTPASTGWGLGLPILATGALISPYAALSVLGATIAHRVRERISPFWWLPLGNLVYAISAVLFLALDTSWLTVFVVMAIAGIGSGITFAQIPGLLVMSVPQRETGSAMGFAMVVRLLGFSVGSTVASVVLAGGGNRPTETGVLAALWVNLGIWVAALVVATGVGIRGRLRSGSLPALVESSPVT